MVLRNRARLFQTRINKKCVDEESVSKSIKIVYRVTDKEEDKMKTIKSYNDEYIFILITQKSSNII